MNNPKTAILGSGIAGISAGHYLKRIGQQSVIFEKDNDWGGLCGQFSINGFRFDRFVHFTFTNNREISDIFQHSSQLIAHPSISYNYFEGKWLKHPVQNNLSPLPTKMKVKIIDDFVNRPKTQFENISNYAQWLDSQYGFYFAKTFPYAYTRKYWGVNPDQLETKWVGNRMHTPSLPEVLNGAFEEQNENFYYTSYMKYPKVGGFRSILNDVRKGLDIKFKKTVIAIDPDLKKIYFSDGTIELYDKLISSLPLKEIVNMLPNVPQEVVVASSKLKHTSGYMVSLGFNRPNVAKHLWFYIYDESILPSRVYSPSMKSPDNVPDGCSSLQAEVFFSNDSWIPSAEEIQSQVVDQLEKIGLFSKNEIVVNDIRFEKYANIIFDHDIYKNRKTVIDFLNSIGIKTIGRFGKWEYFWTDQAFLDGKQTAEKLEI